MFSGARITMVIFKNLYHFRFSLSTSGLHYLLMELSEIWYIKVFDGEEDDADTFNPVGRGAGVLARTPNISLNHKGCETAPLSGHFVL